MIRRMLEAVKLKSSIYEEVEADKSATLQALLVVVLASLASGIALIGMPDQNTGDQSPVVLIIGTVVLALLVWALLAMIAYLVGTKLFPTSETSADWGELARTLGFAQSVGILKIFGLLPVIGSTVFAIISIWTLVATVIAIRQALDYTSTLRAVIVTIVSYIPTILLLYLIVNLIS